MKKKIFKSALAAVLGLSLVGGGTFAAFNDVEEARLHAEAGKLDLAVNPTIAFDVENIKPGDSMRRNFEITNVGTLNIEKVLMHTSYIVYDKSGNIVSPETAREFADQYLVTFFTTDGARIADGLGKTIAQIKELTDVQKSVDITTYIKIITNEVDLPVGDTDKIVMELLFKNDLTKDTTSRLYKQNKFQGYKMEVQFDLEATQYRDGKIQMN